MFETLNDFNLSHAEDEDKENVDVILAEAKRCDTLVYAPGVGKAKKHSFQLRSLQVLSLLKPYEKKLSCIADKSGTMRFVHPLTPCVREWNLMKFKLATFLTLVVIQYLLRGKRMQKNKEYVKLPALLMGRELMLGT